MTPTTPTDEQATLREGLVPWLAQINEGHLERDARAEFSFDAWKVLQRTDLFGLPFAEHHGGTGHDLLTTMHVLEELGAGCRDAGLSFSAVTHMVSTGVAVAQFGKPELRAAVLPGVCAGTTIGAHAITEPDSGSEALAMQTTARRDGDGFVLTGAKSFVTNGPIADLVVVYARTGERAGPFATTAFLVERDSPGVVFGPPEAKMGLRTSPLGTLHLDDVRVPATHVLGHIGSGFLVLDHVMRWEILCSFAVTAGEMRHRLDRCLAHTRERVQFGVPIGAHQAVSHRLVDMEIGLRTARSWLFGTAARMVAGENVTTDVAMAKLVTSEANLTSALAAVQLFGGAGYLTAPGIEKELRNATAGTLYSGTSEIQRNRIASMLGLG